MSYIRIRLETQYRSPHHVSCFLKDKRKISKLATKEKTQNQWNELFAQFFSNKFLRVCNCYGLDQFWNNCATTCTAVFMLLLPQKGNATHTPLWLYNFMEALLGDYWLLVYMYTIFYFFFFFFFLPDCHYHFWLILVRGKSRVVVAITTAPSFTILREFIFVSSTLFYYFGLNFWCSSKNSAITFLWEKVIHKNGVLGDASWNRGLRLTDLHSYILRIFFFSFTKKSTYQFYLLLKPRRKCKHLWCTFIAFKITQRVVL